MEAQLVPDIPEGPGWLYEPKWDGFRCLIFKDGGTVVLQSKSGQRLGRYFPELVDAIAALQAPRLVLDGEIVLLRGRQLQFDALLQRIHPAESRVRKLAAETPCTVMVFDLLVDPEGTSMVDVDLAERRRRLEAWFASAKPGKQLRLSPAKPDRRQALAWMTDWAAYGCDGVVAKHLAMGYRSGERDGMVKVKRIRTADCVVGGFRYDQTGRKIGSL
ncbi:MAG: hypothetical protein JO332_01825, partial [Planctomycetaceae bacterium]|nr:hypothetical protein [Planctomycetaceae bacterium]